MELEDLMLSEVCQRGHIQDILPICASKCNKQENEKYQNGQPPGSGLEK